MSHSNTNAISRHELHVKVAPRTTRSRIARWLGDTFKLRVKPPPERSKANLAVEELLSRVLAVPKDAVTIVAGKTLTRKVVEIAGLSGSEMRERLTKHAA